MRHSTDKLSFRYVNQSFGAHKILMKISQQPESKNVPKLLGYAQCSHHSS